MKSFHELFISELNRLYSAERQLLEALPALIQEISSDKLKEALTEHIEETKWQVTRLEEITREMGVEPSPHESPVIRILMDEVHDHLKADYDPHVKDAALIAVLQKVKHAEMAAYGVLKAFARNMKKRHMEKLLHSSAHEEGRFDRKLTEIAEGKFFTPGINAHAMKHAA